MTPNLLPYLIAILICIKFFFNNKTQFIISIWIISIVYTGLMSYLKIKIK